MMNGPQLCIVPTTLVSGDGVDTVGVHFQSTLSTFSQGDLLNFLLPLLEFLDPESNDQLPRQRQRDSSHGSSSMFPRAEEIL